MNTTLREATPKQIRDYLRGVTDPMSHRARDLAADLAADGLRASLGKINHHRHQLFVGPTKRTPSKPTAKTKLREKTVRCKRYYSFNFNMDIPPKGEIAIVLRNGRKFVIGTLVVSECGVSYRPPKSKAKEVRKLTWTAWQSLMRSGLLG